MRRYRTLTFVAFVISPITSFAQEWALEADVELVSHYEWRGLQLDPGFNSQHSVYGSLAWRDLILTTGVWSLTDLSSEAGEQRCWNHKMRNVLDRLPQREQGEAKDLLRAVVYAPSRAEAVKAREVFARRYRPWYPKAVDVLEDDWERMVAFYDFPEAHWKHLRTTNVVESPFAAVRLRTSAAKRFKRVESATALIWKLLLVAEKRFRRLDAPHLLKDVFEGRKFEDGKPVSTQQRKNAA